MACRGLVRFQTVITGSLFSRGHSQRLHEVVYKGPSRGKWLTSTSQYIFILTSTSTVNNRHLALVALDGQNYTKPWGGWGGEGVFAPPPSYIFLLSIYIFKIYIFFKPTLIICLFMYKIMAPFYYGCFYLFQVLFNGRADLPPRDFCNSDRPGLPGLSVYCVPYLYQ